MIPILYDIKARNFSDNGLGGVPHWIEPPLVTREVNGEYTFAGVYSVAGLHYDRLSCDRILLIQPAPGNAPQPFRIARVNPTDDGKCAVEGEHVAYETKNAIRLPGYTPRSENALTALQRLFSVSDTFPPLDAFTVESDITLTAAPDVAATVKPENVWELLTRDKDGILALFGGELDMDFWTIRLVRRLGKDTGVTLRWGKDLTAVSAETDARELVTAVLPFYCKTEKDNSTGAETTTYLAGDVSYAEDYALLGYVRAEAVDFTGSFDDSNPVTKAKLTALGIEQVSGSSAGQLTTSITLEVIPEALKQARIGDTVTVEHQQLLLKSSAEIVKTVYDPIREKYTSISIGAIRRNAADTIARMMKKF